MKDGFLAVTGTGGTFVLTDLNPWLGFACGVLTLVHVSTAIYRQWSRKNGEKEKQG